MKNKPQEVDLDAIKEAVRVLNYGGIVVYPTDTAYGLAVDATNLTAIKNLFELKGRKSNKPVHVVFPSFSDLNKTVKLNPVAKKLITKYFPGPLTLVLPLKAKTKNWKVLSSDSGFIGFRLPDHPVVKALMQEFKKPITTTSANRSGRGNPYTIPVVKKQFSKSKHKPDLYLNAGKLKKTKPSTVIRFVDSKIEVLREGPIKITQIQKAI